MYILVLDSFKLDILSQLFQLVSNSLSSLESNDVLLILNVIIGFEYCIKYSYLKVSNSSINFSIKQNVTKLLNSLLYSALSLMNKMPVKRECYDAFFKSVGFFMPRKLNKWFLLEDNNTFVPDNLKSLIIKTDYKQCNNLLMFLSYFVSSQYFSSCSSIFYNNMLNVGDQYNVSTFKKWLKLNLYVCVSYIFN